MAKKKGSSVSKFHSLMESAKDDLQELDKVYSGSASNKLKDEKESNEKVLEGKEASIKEVKEQKDLEVEKGEKGKEEKEIVGEAEKEENPLEEKETSIKEVKEQKDLEVEKGEKGEVVEDEKELEEKEKIGKEGKGVKGKKEKDEKKVYSVSYKITEKFDLAMLILSKSDKFPIRGKTEMLDYILEKFCEKKAIQEILNEGIKF